MHWVTPPEIAGRRKKEPDLFFDGKWWNDGRMTEYTRLTKTMTPVWSSAVKIDVSAELRAAFTWPEPVKLDVPMQPDAPVEVPTNPVSRQVRPAVAGHHHRLPRARCGGPFLCPVLGGPHADFDRSIRRRWVDRPPRAGAGCALEHLRAAGGLAWYLWTKFQSYRATTRPQDVTTAGKKLPLTPTGSKKLRRSPSWRRCRAASGNACSPDNDAGLNAWRG